MDGIFDYLDECPEKAGPLANNGCPWPDTDLDGILDKDDRCPNNPGPKENDGCPYVDTDGDSIFDKDDDCPNVPGVRENNGCPLIEVAEQEIINTAFSALEFLSGKAVIRDESFASLDELAALLIKKPDWKLKLSGHTDNVGGEQANLILSKRRAEAVQDHLAEKGVEKERIKVEFFGETKPLESNDTPEGRQKNRRVEMEIQFE
jgi:outer membrane protein OmpA-like peptidoglycan-associated protein